MPQGISSGSFLSRGSGLKRTYPPRDHETRSVFASLCGSSRSLRFALAMHRDSYELQHLAGVLEAVLDHEGDEAGGTDD